MVTARMRAFEGHRVTEVIRCGKRYPNGILLILNFNKINIPKFPSNTRIVLSSKLNELLLKVRSYLTRPKVRSA